MECAENHKKKNGEMPKAIADRQTWSVGWEKSKRSFPLNLSLIKKSACKTISKIVIRPALTRVRS